MTPTAFLEELFQSGRYPDAVKLLALLLPRREGVWWACLCLRHGGGEPLIPALDTALRLAVRWVLEPTEPRRQHAERMAGEGNPRDYLLRAIAYTGGSLAPPPAPPIPPSPVLTPRCLAAAILLMSTRGDPYQITARLRQFVAIGHRVLNGKHLWQARPEAAARGRG